MKIIKHVPAGRWLKEHYRLIDQNRVGYLYIVEEDRVFHDLPPFTPTDCDTAMQIRATMRQYHFALRNSKTAQRRAEGV